MLIYIVRHGETDLNRQGIMQGWLDEPLNENGILLAKLTGQGMKSIRFDACISSPLCRAWKTARLVLEESGNGELPISTDERLKELGFGDCEGMRVDQWPLPYAEAQKIFTDTFAFGGLPNAETISALCARTSAFLDELIARDDDKTWLVATHGCALRAMLNRFYDDPTDFWQGQTPPNCAVNILEAKGGQAKLIARDYLYYDERYRPESKYLLK